MTFRREFNGSAALAVLTVAGCTGASQAPPERYAFEAMDRQVRPDRDAEIRVRLINRSDGRPVAGAVIQEPRLGMWPATLHKTIRPWMSHTVSPAVAEGDGVYRFRADLAMAGNYWLTLAARVPGEAEPLRGTVRIRAAY